MNLTISPLSNNNQYRQQFTAAKPQAAMDTVEQALTSQKESGLFAPIEKAYGKMTDKIAEKFTSKVAEWELLHKLGNKFKDSKNLFQYCLTTGAVITSGMYMQQTYTNKKLDKDRRNTLVVNQGLTLALSTAGSFLLDKYVKNWWENVTARFAGHLLDDKDFHEKFVSDKKDIMAKNKTLAKDAKKKLPNLDKYIRGNNKFKAMTDGDAKALMSKIKGMGVLRSMIVFGFVYRFFVPVAVTKPANKLCEMYLEKKKAKEAQKSA